MTVSEGPSETGRGRGSRGRAQVVLGLVLAILAFYGLFYRGHFQTSDEGCVFEAAVSLWEAGNVGISPGPAHYHVPGRHGLSYTMVNSGLSVAVQPLLAVSRVVMALAADGHVDEGVRRLANPFGNSPEDVDIFFALALDVIFTAAWVAVFFVFTVRLGTRPATAAWLSLVVGTCTYAGGFATNWFQHASETLFVLLAFCLLHEDARSPSSRTRLYAGLAACLLIQFRFPAIQAWLPLGLYHVFVLRGRRAGLREGREFAAGLALGLLLHFADQYWKFDTLGMVGDYGTATFESSLWVSWRGFLLSPGDSVFLYTPLLLLLPWTLPPLWRSHRSEALGVILLVLTYLVGCGSFQHWSGVWCFGPRYLAATVPVLLLPLGPWIDRHPRAWRVVVPLALAGLVVNVLHLTVNFNAIFRSEGYAASKPEYQFLFEPWRSPLLAHGRALLNLDTRADFWLLNVGRSQGLGLAWGLATCFVGGVALGVLRIRAGLRLLASWPATRADVVGGNQPEAPSRPAWNVLGGRRLVAALVLLTWMGTAVAWSLPSLHRPLSWDMSARALTERMMDAGRDRLYLGRDPAAAATWFRRAIEADPRHVGAHYQLALAMEASGRDAREVWRSAYRLALEQGRTRLARDIERHLGGR